MTITDDRMTSLDELGFDWSPDFSVGKREKLFRVFEVPKEDYVSYTLHICSDICCYSDLVFIKVI